MSEQHQSQPVGAEAVAFSNAIRLTGKEWLIVAAFGLLLFFIPSLWKRVEKIEYEPDQRMAYALSDDYWLFERYAQLAADQCDTLLLGDSVIWGEYVTGKETLSHYLNQLSGQQRCANLGLNGAHPLALEGLIRYYGGSIANKTVLIQCNPLWVSSPKADLQETKENKFNHPDLVPQFVPMIPSYQAEVSARLGAVVKRYIALNQWTSHVQQAYYDQKDIPGWTLEHPYENPLAPLARGLPPTDHTLRHSPIPWYEAGNTKQSFPWVDLETSFQWQAFQRAVKILQERGNRVFVLVGPFNEHMLTAANLPKYQQVKSTIAAWLQAQQIPYLVAPPLPSELYGDASHPLAAGYELLARQLLERQFFAYMRQKGS